MANDFVSAASGRPDELRHSVAEGPRHRRSAQASFVAAVFVVGLFGGYQLAPADGAASAVVYEGGRLIATGELESVLYNPGFRSGEKGPKAGGEFMNPEGHTCRPFTEGKIKGSACRRGGDWSIAALRQVDLPSGTKSP